MSHLSPEQVQYYKEHASDTLQPNIIIKSALGLPFAYIFVALRWMARRNARLAYGADDWLILLALIPLTIYAVSGFVAVHFGEGKHILFVKSPAGFIKSYVVGISSYALAVVLTKSSILCFYCRIFSSSALFKTSIVFGAFVIMYNLALVLVAALECIPLSSLWTGRPGKCIDTLPPYTALGIINVITDFAILALPIRFVVALQMKTVRKMQVCGIFLLGSVVCIFGTVRVVALAQAPPGDQTYTQVWSGIWSFCELFIGIIAACLPTLASIVSKARWNTVTNSARHLFSYSLPRRSRSTEASTSDVDLSEHPLPEYRTWTNAGYEERSGQSEDAKTHVSSVESDRNGIIIKNEFRQTHEVV